MKVYSYNLNGIRSALQKGLVQWVGQVRPDVLCIQETKAQPEQIDEGVIEALGYEGYFFSAQRRGYSGVGIICSTRPDNVVLGMGDELFDIEGRVLRCDFGDITIVCVYVPSGSMGDERQEVKMQFLRSFQQWVDQLRQVRPNLIVCGDFNICHKAIDINHPERQNGVSGFLPEERAWMDSWAESGFVDSFRMFDQRAEQYSWWSYRMRSRERNMGWRIDYCWVTQNLRERVKNAQIHQDIVHSDHCPVSVWID